MNDFNLEVKILDKRLLLDFGEMFGYAKEGDAGIDVRACISDSWCIGPGETKLVPLGFAINIGNPYIMATLHPRSGLGAKDGVVLGNLTGIIDSGYQGQVQAAIWNRNRDKTITIEPMQRIAQMIFIPIVRANHFYVVDEFSKTSDRGNGGFGHTGDK